MALKDLSHLPQAEKTEGNPPDQKPYFAEKLAQAWADKLDDGAKNMAFPEARIRHSWAGSCARKIGYQMLGVDPTNSSDMAGRWVMLLGTMIHEYWQEIMQEQFPDSEMEKKVFLDDCQSAGHIDMFLNKRNEEGDLIEGGTAVELKTTGGFSFKLAAGARGPAEGPRTSAVMQASLNGLGSGADKVVVINIATENMSQREASKIGPEYWRKFTAEWSYEQEQFLPVALGEVSRFRKIIEMVDRGDLPPRSVPFEMPRGARVVDPMTGAWTLIESDMVVQAGTHWSCQSYCSYRDKCVADG